MFREVSRQPELFSSAIGNTNLWDLEADALEARRSLIDTDAPDHTRLRRVVARAFTPTATLNWEGIARAIATDLVDRFVAQGGGDWVAAVAAPLPMRVISAILGVPDERVEMLVELSDHLVEATTDEPSLPDDAYGNTTPVRLLPFASPAGHAMFELGSQLGIERRADPQADFVTKLVLAEDHGERLTEVEFRNFFALLVFAGNETTRTALSQGIIAFATHVDQWERLRSDRSLLPHAVEEVLRWATPVLHMRRTAGRDTELSGTAIAAGDKVVMWYVSANRDELAFDSPSTFDIGRDPNDHQAFGGGGAHFCLGAALARMELGVVLEELLKHEVTPMLASEVERVPSNFVQGIRRVEILV